MMRLAEFDEKKVELGVDGCGVPTCAIPVKNMAILYANFSTPERFGGKLADACLRVIKCVHRYPRNIAGPGRYCTELLEATGKKLFAKGGAEAIYTIGVVGKRTGIAIKMESGLEIGYKVFLVSLMREMNIISAADVSRLPQYVRNPILNRRGEMVGWVEAEKPRAAGKSPKGTSRRRA
jgi:L-asparaginase II